MNPTVIGLFAVLVWGISLSFMRLIEEQIGTLAYMGTVFALTGAMGLANHLLRRRPFPGREVLRHPAFYGRWLFFVLHEGLLVIGISIVQRPHLPFLILVNYLWPTAIILSSLLLAGVRITRAWAFWLGSVIVLASLSLEMLGPEGFSPDLFALPTDCLAYGLVFAGALSWGLYSALSRRAGAAAGGGTVIPLFQLTLGVVLPVSFLPGLASWGNLTPLAALALCVYCFVQFFAYLAWDHGMQRGNVVVLSLCADFIPWVSLLAAWLLLGVDIGNRTIFSAASLVCGAMVTRYGTLEKKTKRLPDAPPDI